MARIHSILALCVMSALPVIMRAEPAEKEDIFEPIIEINLVKDAHAAVSYGKHMMVMFVKDGCSPCIKMKTRVLVDPAVRKYFTRHFLNYSVNIYGDLPVINQDGSEMTEKTYAQSNGIWGTPVFYFYGTHGQLVYKHAGALSIQDFMRLGKYISTRQYRTNSFADTKNTM